MKRSDYHLRLSNQNKEEERQAVNSASLGEGTALAYGEGAAATVEQNVYQTFVVNIFYLNDTVGSNAKVELTELAKLLNITVKKDGNLVINGEEVDTGEPNQGVKTIILSKKDVNKISSNEQNQ